MLECIKGKNELQYALCLLANVDDGAASRDAKGFNKNDTEMGNRLAGIPQETWGEQTKKIVLGVLKKYKKQLLGKGFDYDEMLWKYFYLDKVKFP